MKHLMNNGREWYRDYHRCEMKIRKQLYRSLSKDIKEGAFSEIKAHPCFTLIG